MLGDLVGKVKALLNLECAEVRTEEQSGAGNWIETTEASAHQLNTDAGNVLLDHLTDSGLRWKIDK
jgi:hypothetical protein